MYEHHLSETKQSSAYSVVATWLMLFIFIFISETAIAQPSIEVSNGEMVEAGTEITVEGSGFGPNQEIVSLLLTTEDDEQFSAGSTGDSFPLDMKPNIISGSLSTDEIGAFSVQAAVPGDLSAGNYLLGAWVADDNAGELFASVVFPVVFSETPPGDGGTSLPVLSFVTQPPAEVAVEETIEAGESFDVRSEIIDVEVEILQDGVRLETDDLIGLELLNPNGPLDTLLEGTTAVRAVDGLASFSINLYGSPQDGLQLRAKNITYPSVDPQMSQQFDFSETIPEVPQIVSVNNQLMDTSVLNAGEVQGRYRLSIELRDANGQVDTSVEDIISVSIAGDLGSITLTGDTQEQAVQGVAVFDNLLLNAPPDTQVTLEISDLTTAEVIPIYVRLDPLTVAQQVPAAMMVTTQPPNEVAPGASFSIGVQLADEHGDPLLLGSTASIGDLNLELLVPEVSTYAADAYIGSVNTVLTGATASVELSVENGVGSGLRLRLSDPTHPELGTVTTELFDVSGPAYIKFAELPGKLGTSNPYYVSPGPLVSAGETVIAAVYDQDGELYSSPIDISILVNEQSSAFGSGISLEGTTTATTQNGLAVFNDLMFTEAKGYHGLALRAVPQKALQYADSDYKWVKDVESPQFSIVASKLLFTDELALQENGVIKAIWHKILPSPGQGDTGEFQIPYTFAGIQWNLVDYRAGEPLLLSGDSMGVTGFEVDEKWTLKLSGEIPGREDLLTGAVEGAGSVAEAVYLMSPSQMTDQGLTVTGEIYSLDKLPSGRYGMELTIESSDTETHYGTDSIYLISGRINNEREKLLENTRRPLKIGADVLNVDVGQEVSIPVKIMSAPEPFAGMAVHFDYDPEAVEIKDIIGPEGFFTRKRIARNGVLSLWPQWPGYNGPLEVGETVFTLKVRGLKAGNWPISFVGNSTGWGFGDESSLAYQRMIGDTIFVTVNEPAPIPDAALQDMVIDRNDAAVRFNMTGSELNTAVSAELLAMDGTVLFSSQQLEKTQNGGLVTAVFTPDPTPLPAGVYRVRFLDSNGQIVGEEGNAAVPPAAPFLSVHRDDLHPQLPGKPATHFWRVENHGTVDAVGLIMFGFRDYLEQPQLELDGAPDGTRLLVHRKTGKSWVAYAAVPVKAGSFVNVPWTVILPPEAVFGSEPKIGVGDVVPFFSTVTGAFTQQEWEDFKAEMSAADETAFDKTALVKGSNLWKSNVLAVLQGLDNLSLEELKTYKQSINSSYPEITEHLFDNGNLPFYRELIPLMLKEGE